MKRAWFDDPAEMLANATPQLILGYLTEATQFPAELAQISAWQFTITHLKQLAAALPDAHFFMEFAIPRMGRRADAVIVAGPLILVLEYKVGHLQKPLANGGLIWFTGSEGGSDAPGGIVWAVGPA